MKFIRSTLGFMCAGLLVGGFIFPFLIRMYWGPLVDKFGPAGGFAAGIGLCVASAIQRGKFKKAIPQIGAALVGGTLAGFVLALVF